MLRLVRAKLPKKTKVCGMLATGQKDLPKVYSAHAMFSMP